MIYVVCIDSEDLQDHLEERQASLLGSLHVYPVCQADDDANQQQTRHDANRKFGLVAVVRLVCKGEEHNMDEQTLATLWRRGEIQTP